MSKFETTLRQIIYHYSQQTLPMDVAKENRVVYTLPSGRIIQFAPILKGNDISLDDRMEIARDILLPSSLAFYNATMREEYYDIFCTENLMREIEYETVEYFLKRWKTNIKKCLYKYNKIYGLLDKDIDFLYAYERHLDEKTDDDTLHGKQITKTGDETFTHGMKVENEYDSDSNLIHGMKIKTDNTTSGENKVVFEDTPENELLNESYATSITKTGDESTLDGTQQNSGTDKTERRGTDTTTNSGTDTRSYNSILDAESGKTERDFSRILNEYGRNKSIPEIVEEMFDARMNVIDNMVKETSTGLFMKVW